MKGTHQEKTRLMSRVSQWENSRSQMAAEKRFDPASLNEAVWKVAWEFPA
jgi:hypothetical protein